MNQHQLLFSSMHLPQLIRVKLHHMLVTLNRERMSYACRWMRECVCVRCFACALHTCVCPSSIPHRQTGMRNSWPVRG